MHPLNPFLRAFFRSTLPAQCSPVQHHILLVPSTDVLLNGRDRETSTPYTDLVTSEEFLASHCLRVPNGIPPGNYSAAKDGSSTSSSSTTPTLRDTKSKAKQYSTVNGRTVVVKESFVYSNKGFKTLNQAQLLGDALFAPDALEAQQWLVYYISRPLIGSYEGVGVGIPGALIPSAGQGQGQGREHKGAAAQVNGHAFPVPRKRDVKSFGDLLNAFPMIARQMQPGLERLFREFGKEFEKPLPAPPGRSSSISSRDRISIKSGEETDNTAVASSVHGSLMSNGTAVHPTFIEIDEEEDVMRRHLETAVTAAIDLFQMVDKQQLSLLGATTDLTGPIVERMIERYVAEQVHDSILFPRICAIRRSDDADLESRIRQMMDIDISQVGIPIGPGHHAKQQLALRLQKGVEVFRKMGVAGSPQEMMEILLNTTKAITAHDAPVSHMPRTNGIGAVEKNASTLTVNADTLVSMLLVVVIRSPVRHLQARLSYMRHFIFIDDVESGEMGYALSTFEAVLSYLVKDSGGLRKASKRNRKLWQATKTGNVLAMKEVLEPDRLWDEDAAMDEPEDVETLQPNGIMSPDVELPEFFSRSQPNGIDGVLDDDEDDESFGSYQEESNLAHVFPFIRAPTPPPASPPARIKLKKRVSMEARSMSSSSQLSYRSRTTTIDSHGSGHEGDTSIERLSKTQGTAGDSVLMMATERNQRDSLQYLLSLEEYYTVGDVLADCNNEGTTLLSAAVQLSHTEVVEILIDFIFTRIDDEDMIRLYFAQQDNVGRCVAHYLFNQPRLIPRLGRFMPWRLKDKNGQTPLFALCRSYDHEEYRWMVDAALSSATKTQGDGQPLHIDEHVDSKGNTILHIINDPMLAQRVLYQCDSDVNAANDKRFTPLMIASKYGRTDLVRVMFGDPRVDLNARDLRGLTAVELAKDEEVRNRIDDLVLLSSPPGPDGRITTIVRSFFVEDGTIRLVLKSGAPNSNDTITVTTCRRSLLEFENLAKWLALEHPASWLPSISNFASPFLLPSRPSRAILRDIQIRLDHFLRTLLTHTTFSTHEMVWEFFLVPDMEPSMLEERTKRKAEARVDKVKEEYTPVSDVRDVELFVAHARDMVRGINHSTKSVLRRLNKVRHVTADLYDAHLLSSAALTNTLHFLPQPHLLAFEKYARTLANPDLPPHTHFHYALLSLHTNISAIIAALARPAALIGSMSTTQKQIERHYNSLRRSDRWPLGLLDDTRARMQKDASEKVGKSEQELRSLGSELRYTQQTVASELAGWQDGRVGEVRGAVRELARRMVVLERGRLEGMRRAVRGLEVGGDGRSDGRKDRRVWGKRVWRGGGEDGAGPST